MPEYLGGPKLPTRTIPVTRNCDRSLSIRRRDPDTGDPVDWAADVYILIDIDRTNPTRVDATIAGSLAQIRMQAENLDQVRNGTTWRVVMSQTTETPSRETPVLVGIFERNDGKP